MGGQYLKAYALQSSYEYFAESSESFFTSDRFYNDYYPFINSELHTFDITAWNLVKDVFEVDSKEYQPQTTPEKIKEKIDKNALRVQETETL